MANTINRQVLHDGEVNLIVLVTVTGDGSGEESKSRLIDISDYNGYIEGKWDTVRLDRLVWSLTGFSAQLFWDADTDSNLYNLAGDAPMDEDLRDIGGIPNPLTTGFTGDILLSTVGLGNGDKGSVVLHMRKKI